MMVAAMTLWSEVGWLALACVVLLATYEVLERLGREDGPE